MFEAEPIDLTPILDRCRVLGLQTVLEEIEAELIKKVLAECSGNGAEAADVLKINRTTLAEKRRKYHLLLRRKANSLELIEVAEELKNVKEKL